MNDEIKHEIFMMYDLAGDKDLIYYVAIQRIIDYIADLEQENEDLKGRLENAVADCNLRLQEFKDYKSRIEKAVEYIEEARKQDFMWSPIFMKELLDILNGRSDE